MVRLDRGAPLALAPSVRHSPGVLAIEITIALHTVGLDPALGILHADKDGRASLAYDLLEPARGLTPCLRRRASLRRSIEVATARRWR